jgi:hypothetical protein
MTFFAFPPVLSVIKNRPFARRRQNAVTKTANSANFIAFFIVSSNLNLAMRGLVLLFDAFYRPKRS